MTIAGSGKSGSVTAADVTAHIVTHRCTIWHGGIHWWNTKEWCCKGGWKI